VVVNGSRAALAEAQAAFPALTVLHITAPLDVLADRLAARGRETRADIAARLARAAQSLPEGLPVLEVLNDATPEAGITRLLQALRG
jgi:ribose 1,5-bisphosphokinase